MQTDCVPNDTRYERPPSEVLDAIRLRPSCRPGLVPSSFCHSLGRGFSVRPRSWLTEGFGAACSLAGAGAGLAAAACAAAALAAKEEGPAPNGSLPSA